MPEADLLDGTLYPTKTATVRLAAPADEDALYALLLRLSQDNPDPSGLRFDHDKIQLHVENACARSGAVAGVIDDPNGEGIIGSCGIFLFLPWYADEWILSCYWLYVDPPFRKFGYGDLLFDFALKHRRDLSAASGYPLGLDISFVSRTHLPARERWWGKRAKKVGAMFFVAPDRDVTP